MVIAKTLNSLTASGSYWLANQLIWNWILLPIIALIEVFKAIVTINVDEGINSKELNKKFIKYFKLSFLLFVVSASIFYGLWIPFSRFLTDNDQTKMTESMQIMRIVIWFYLFYTWATLLDAVFIGIGKLKFLLIKSCVINFTVYLIPFILIAVNILFLNIKLIILIYSFSLLGSFIVNLIMYLILLSKNKETMLG
ncbi:hypothetical protein [Spiroplasma sp. ald]|uniref:hypothetical protein n=1 Tax=Spiroplasma sp. ald TaxID=2490849 RepID=UPI0037DD2F9A